MAPFVGVFEILCGALLILALLTRLAAIPMIVSILDRDKPAAQIQGHAFVVAEDGADLATSRRVLVLPLAAGCRYGRTFPIFSSTAPCCGTETS